MPLKFILIPFALLSFSSAELVGYVTLRLLKPMCSINRAWCEENLSSATKRVLSILHTRTVPDPALGSASTASFTELLTAPGFAFCFPLLRCLLREGGKAVDGDEDLRYQALQVVAEHCKLRACDDENEEDEEEQDEVNKLYPVTSNVLVTKATGFAMHCVTLCKSQLCKSPKEHAH